ncbi:MAG: hypothetical protein ACRDIU_06790 [Actinomycetota bacterium]
MGIFRKLEERLDRSPEEEQAPKIREWASKVPGAEFVAKCQPRTHQRVAGVVESIKLTPRDYTYLLEVQIFDGTEQITGVWYGRRKIPGIDLGCRIMLEGTIGCDNDDLKIINPAYALLPA